MNSALKMGFGIGVLMLIASLLAQGGAFTLYLPNNFGIVSDFQSMVAGMDGLAMLVIFLSGVGWMLFK